MPGPEETVIDSVAQRVVDGPADRVLEDRYTDFEGEGGSGGGGVVPTIPSPYPSAVDPGFVTASTDGPLSKAFSKLVAKKPFSDMRIALVDLTADVNRPTYVGYKDNEQTFIASTGKLAILVAAFALREAVRDAVPVIQVKKVAEFLPKLAREWRGKFSKGFRNGEKVHNSVPKLAEIFSVSRTAPADPLIVDFKRRPAGNTTDLFFFERMQGSLKSSSNEGSKFCIGLLGFPYINQVMKAAGLFTTKGLWLSTNFVDRIWDPSHKGSNTAATARSIAHLLTLIAQDRLFPRTMEKDYRDVMAGEGVYASSDMETGIRDSLPEALRFSHQWQGKVGYNVDKPPITYGDAIIMRRSGPKTKKNLVYVAVAFSGSSHKEIGQVGVELDDCILLAHGEEAKPPRPNP